MELIVSIVVLVVIVWYFGSALGSLGDTINHVLEGSSRMAKEKMTVYEASSKSSSIDAMADIEIDTDKVAKAKANIEALKSIDL